MKKIINFLFFLISFSFSFAQEKNIVEENIDTYNFFKFYFVKDIEANNATEEEIMETFIASYNYDKFELSFKIKFYANFFINNEIYKTINLEKEDIIALTTYALKYDVFNENSKMYTKNFKELKDNYVKHLLIAIKNNFKVKFVETREDMISKEREDVKDKFNYMPAECYEQVKAYIDIIFKI